MLLPGERGHNACAVLALAGLEHIQGLKAFFELKIAAPNRDDVTPIRAAALRPQTHRFA